IWSYFIESPRLQQEQARQQQVTAQQKAKEPAAQASAPGAPQAGPPAPNVLPRDQALKQGASGRAVIDTPALDRSINLTGGRFDDLKLRNYRETTDPNSPEIELLSPRAADHPYFAELGWVAAQGSNVPAPGPDTQWRLVEGDKLTPENAIELS